MAVDTAHSEYRALRFENPDQLFAEIERIAVAERAGKLKSTGNWSAGQTFGHLAAWINYAYDGYPADLKPSWMIKMVLKLMKKKFMRGPLPRGVRIPNIKGGTHGTEPLSLDDGLAKVRAAWERLRKTPPSKPNPIFGPMSHAEWINMHLRHGELHMGYLQPL